MSDFSYMKKENARGIYGKRTTMYDNYVFDIPKDKKFYAENRDPYVYEVFNRPDSYWSEKRMEQLNKVEKGVYKILDTLTTVSKFKTYYSLAITLARGYYKLENLDIGP